MVVRRRLNLCGPQVAFVTTTASNFTPVFADRQIADIAVDQLQTSLSFHHVSAIGWVLMPTHLHTLLGFPQIELLSTFMRDFKGLASKRIEPLLCADIRNQLGGRGEFHLWMRRYDDVIIYSAKQMEIKLHYIHNNPVKASLVQEATEWVNSSASDWSTVRSGPIPVDKDWKWM